MKIHDLGPAPGSRQPRKRVGRGIAAGQGKTSGRGQKGQGSRSSSGLPRSFEGGQMPLAQRLPKLRGFTNINRKEYAVVNLGKLNRFDKDTEVNPQLLQEVGLVRKPLDGIKILAAGELKVALKVSAHRVSSGARKAIEAAGGSVELLGPQTADKPEKRAKKNARTAAAAAKAGPARAASPAGAAPPAPDPEASVEPAAAAAAPEASAEPAAGSDENDPSDAPKGE
jgi:large subunit ribosomal protein L15